MIEKINLKEIERKAYRSFFQDGIYDVVWGIMLIGFGLSPLLKNIGLARPLNIVVFPILALVILLVGKKYITTPRLGVVKFGPKRKSDKQKMWKLASIIMLIQIILILLIKNEAFSSLGEMHKSNSIIPLIVSLFLVTFSAIIAHFLGFPRFFLFGLMMAISYPAAGILYKYIGAPLDGLIPFCISGLILVFYGIVLLIRFLKKYPKSELEVSHVKKN